MKNILINVKEFYKINKKRIITIVTISVLTVVIGLGTVGGVVFSRAKDNIKYTQEELQQIALEKVPGKVIKVEKELDLEEAIYEYEFSIKDKENMLRTVKLDSKNGVILEVDD